MSAADRSAAALERMADAVCTAARAIAHRERVRRCAGIARCRRSDVEAFIAGTDTADLPEPLRDDRQRRHTAIAAALAWLDEQ